MRPEGAAIFTVSPAIIFKTPGAAGNRQIAFRQLQQPVLSAVEAGKVLTDDLLSSVAFGAARTGVPVHDAAARIQHIDRVVLHPFHQHTKGLLTFKLFMLHPALFGTVARHFRIADQPALIIPDGINDHVRPEGRAIFAVAPALGLIASAIKRDRQPLLRRSLQPVLFTVKTAKILANNFSR